jgi:hypothetical protein
MDRRQVDLAEKFKEEHHTFYSRQEGVFVNLSDEDRQEMGIEASTDIGIRPLAQTFLAVQGDVYNMSRMPDVFESQQLYEKTFKTSYLGVDCRAIVLGYKIGLMIRRAMTRLEELAPAKYQDAVPAARNLTWALLIRALINDKKYGECLELYGERLTREADFGEVLKRLTSSRVWPILKEILASPTYRDKVDNQKYDFLRTTDAYKKAVHIAHNLSFDWGKNSF